MRPPSFTDGDREWHRNLGIDCAICGDKYTYVLHADEMLTQQECDDLAEAWLDSQGWTTKLSIGDICPRCAEGQAREDG